MSNWYDRAVAELEQELEREEITYAEYQRCMRDLREELRDEAEEAARNAYNDVIGGF